MGSQIKLTKTLKDLRNVQKCHIVHVKDEYNLGVYNGMELAWSLLNGIDADFMNLIDNKAVKSSELSNKQNN